MTNILEDRIELLEDGLLVMLLTCNMCGGSGQIKTEAEDERGNHIEQGECYACAGTGYQRAHVPVKEFVSCLRVVLDLPSTHEADDGSICAKGPMPTAIKIPESVATPGLAGTWEQVCNWDGKKARVALTHAIDILRDVITVERAGYVRDVVCKAQAFMDEHELLRPETLDSE